MVGIGYDSHRFAAGRRLVLGGVEIDHPQGLAGHSDADVLTHAVIDAILGTALGLLASAFARTEFQAVQFMPLIVFPQILLGGLFMPRDEMPEALYVISNFLPLSYAIDAINAVTAGDDEWDVYGPVLVVLGFAVGSLILASLTLRRRTP